MSYARTISPFIGQEKRLMSVSDSAALLFTWIVPHVDGNYLIRSDPQELGWTISPGRASWTVSKIAKLLDELRDAHLVMEANEGYIYVDITAARKNRCRDSNYITWRMMVLASGKWMCAKCGDSGPPLHAHHIKPWAQFPLLRFDTNNGMVLCEECHRLLHQEASNGS